MRVTFFEVPPLKAMLSKEFMRAYRAGRWAGRHGLRKTAQRADETEWQASFRKYWNEGHDDAVECRHDRYTDADAANSESGKAESGKAENV